MTSTARRARRFSDDDLTQQDEPFMSHDSIDANGINFANLQGNLIFKSLKTLANLMF